MSDSKKRDDRDGARRQHRIVALFAMLQCWKRGCDGIVIERSDLETLLGLKKVNKYRIAWIKEDFSGLFQAVEPVRLTRGSIGLLYLSRGTLSIPKDLVPGEMREALKKMKFPRFEIWEEPSARLGKIEALNPFLSAAESTSVEERLLTSYLLLLSQGHISVDSIPTLHWPGSFLNSN